MKRNKAINMFGLFKSKAKKYQTIDVPEFKSLKGQSGTVVLDVRTSQEKVEGYITGAQQINFLSPTFKNKLAQLDKSKTYLVYCRSGSRSKRACATMGQMGFEKVYNLSGGIVAWNLEK